MVARPEKEEAVAQIKERLLRAKSVILTDYRGLNVGEETELRRKLRAAGIEYQVVKNTLTQRAARAVEIEGLDQFLAGPTAMAFGYDDPAAPARILADFARDHKNLELKAGLLGREVLDQAQVKALANLPSREQLLTMVAGMIQSPLRGLASVLAGPMRNLVCGFEALRKMRAGESAEA